MLLEECQGRNVVKRDAADHLHKYARRHPGTKIIYADAQRFAPYEWPAWYMRTLQNSGGHYRFAYPKTFGSQRGFVGHVAAGGGGPQGAIPYQRLLQLNWNEHKTPTLHSNNNKYSTFEITWHFFKLQKFSTSFLL